jgi:hypothetical protein
MPADPITAPRTIMGHRVMRGSPAEARLCAAYRHEINRFMGFPPGQPSRGFSKRYASGEARNRDHEIANAASSTGYLGKEPGLSDRVNALPAPVAALLNGPSADMCAAVALALSVSRDEAAMMLGMSLPPGQCSALALALDVIEFGVAGAKARARENP